MIIDIKGTIYDAMVEVDLTHYVDANMVNEFIAKGLIDARDVTSVAGVGTITTEELTEEVIARIMNGYIDIGHLMNRVIVSKAKNSGMNDG